MTKTLLKSIPYLFAAALLVVGITKLGAIIERTADTYVQYAIDQVQATDFYTKNHYDRVGGAGFTFGQRYHLSAGDAAVNAGEPSATTSVHYLLTTSASSTITIPNTDRSTKIAIKATGVASTSATTYSCYVQYGDDGVDWFDQDLVTDTSNIAQSHSSTTPRHTWQPSTTDQWWKYITFDNISAERAKVTCGVTGANGSLWMEAQSVEPIPN